MHQEPDPGVLPPDTKTPFSTVDCPAYAWRTLCRQIRTNEHLSHPSLRRLPSRKCAWPRTWNTRDPHKVSLAYTPDSLWRNRSEFLTGREAIVRFLTRKWNKELDYRLIKELWVYRDVRIVVRFACEWHDHSGNWFGSYGNENWEFDGNGLMRRRIASINDLPQGI